MRINRRKVQLAMARKCIGAAELTKAAKMPRPTTNKALSGGSVRPETAGRIAKALGVDVTEIIDNE